METSRKNRFADTRGTWVVLLCATSAWLATSVWAYKVAVSDGLTGKNLYESDGLTGTNLDESSEVSTVRSTELIAVSSTHRLADLEATEVADEAQLVAKRQADIEARLAAEQQAAEEARLAAEEQAAEEARLAAEQQAAEEARLAAEEQSREAEQARQAALLEARRVSEATTRLSAYEQLKIDELSVLSGLSDRLRFQGRSEEVSKDVERTLDQVFEPLFLYSEMPVLIVVASNEYNDIAENTRLSRDRAGSVVDYLVSRGLELDRFRIETENGVGLPYGTHHVKLFVEDPVE